MEDHSSSNANPSNHHRLQCPTPPLANPAAAAAATAAPFRAPYHRRAHSEVQFRLPDDLDLSDPFGGFDELGSEDDLFCYMDMEKLGSGSGSDSAGQSIPKVDYPIRVENAGGVGDEQGNSNDNSKPRHRHSLSVDGSTTLESIDAKKAMAPDKLAELWVADPKRAKRIIANRQSAARSKERKARYILELERKVQTLQTEATTLSAQLSLYQRDTTGLSSENTELKLRLQAMEQQAQLRDALNEALKKEVERLKVATGEISAADAYNLGMVPNCMPYSQTAQPFFQTQPQASPPDTQNMQMAPQFHLFHHNSNMQGHPNMPSSSRQGHQSMLGGAGSGQSRSFLETMHQDPLGRLQGLDISSCGRGSNFGRSESVSESSSSM